MGAFFLTVTSPVFAANPDHADKLTFITLADLHFDPFFSCHDKTPCPLIRQLKAASYQQWPSILNVYRNEASQYQQDTNYALLSSSLAVAKKAAEERKVKYVIVLGDFLAHEYRVKYKKYGNDKSFSGYQAFVKKTMGFLTDELAQTFPNIDVYAVIGNNDSYHGDYVSIARGQFFKDTSTMWATLIKSKDNRERLQNVFPIGGYYAVTVPRDPHLRLIILNTVFFSYKAMAKNNDKSATEELTWLHNQLQSAQQQHQKVIIAMHIPMGVDMYATLQVHFFRLVDLWKLNFTKIFEADLKEFASEVVGVLSGHLHSSWSQELTIDNSHIPMSGTISISPIFGNNPGFKVYTYSLNNQQLEKADELAVPANFKGE